MKTQVFLGAIFLMSSPVAVQALPAFYGAEGGGALSVGGRGGTVCQVTNLNNSGAGSLRECIDTHNNTSGSRMTVVFRVGGTINLTSRLTISNPYITIAGHTAPGGGIQIKANSFGGDVIWVIEDHVIIRYLTIRKGFFSTESRSTTIRFRGRSNIVDHVSGYWTNAAVFITYGDASLSGYLPRNITFQNSILAEPLRGRSMGHLVGTNDAVNSGPQITDIDLVKNLLAHAGWRLPLFRAGRGRIVNNIMYNWWMFATHIAGGVHMDIINNLYKHPNAPAGVNRPAEIGVNLYNPNSVSGSLAMRGDPSLYVAGNQGPLFGSDNWNMVQMVDNDEHATLRGAAPSEYRRSSPLAPVGVPITVIPTDQLESTLYPIVGNSRRLDCMGNWVNKRDSHDTRIVNHAQTNYNPNFVAGRNNWGISSENDVGGFPTIAGGTPCQDTDGDGMPDEWEDAMGLNKNDPSDRNTLHPSGYTMLEMYLNGPMTTNTTITTPANVRFVQ